MLNVFVGDCLDLEVRFRMMFARPTSMGGDLGGQQGRSP